MRNWLYLHWRAFLHASTRLARQPLGTLLSALVMGIALALPAGAYILLDNIASLARGLSGTPEISLFLDAATQSGGDGSTSANANGDASESKNGDDDKLASAIEQRLQAETELASFRFVPRDEALRQLERSGLGDVLGGLAANPLPDAFIITLRSEDPAVYEKLAERMQAWPGVIHVQLDSAWVKRLHALLGLGRMAVLVLATLLGLALVIVTFNTIRLQILTQKMEIEVSRLLGATDPFIRRPFYWFGVLQGILGGLVALGVVWAGVAALVDPVTALAETYGAVFTLSGPDDASALGVVAFAAFLGWLGTEISVQRHLTEPF
ncbi:MAG: ABC transporter permease [Azoarcus sp.]|nr:ABC transporter permease [Azoarcus sp.]